MELRMVGNETKIMTLAYVTDEDAKILEIAGYHHCAEEDFMADNEYLEVWKPNK